MPRIRAKLTPKQRHFVKEYATLGSATDAALLSYNTKSRNNARNIAYDNLSKPEIKNELEVVFRKLGYDSDYIASKLNKVIEKGVEEKPTAADALRGLETMIKVFDYYPTQKRANLNVNINPYENLSYKEIISELRKTREATEKLLKDIE